MSSREIAVRGFINEKFGKTYGRSLYHYAFYNGTIELGKPRNKYVIDFFEYSRWDMSAKTEDQLAWSKELYEAGVHQLPEALVSWVKYYNPVTKEKRLVNGVCFYLPISQELYLNIKDPEHEVIDEWVLPTKNCSKSGDNKPVFIATNVDLAVF